MERRAGAIAVVIGGVAIAIALAFELTRVPAPRVLAEDVAAPPIRASSAPSSSSSAPAQVALVDASTDAGATGAGGYTARVSASPWFFEQRREKGAPGECGMDDATVFDRLRFEGDAGRRVHDFPSSRVSCPEDTTPAVKENATPLFDYDGDGVPELLLMTESTSTTGVFAESGTIWTLAKDAIAPYERGVPPAFAAVEDIDNDHRPDLASRWTYTELGRPPCGDAGFVVPPIFFFHSKPDGTFSANDTVAKKAFDDACGTSKLSETLRDEGWDVLAKAIVCERVRGATAEAVEKTLRAGCASFTDDTCDADLDDAGKRRSCPSWSIAIAKKAPPIRF